VFTASILVPYFIFAYFIVEPAAPEPLNVIVPQLLLVVPDCEVNVIGYSGVPIAFRVPFTIKEEPGANLTVAPGTKFQVSPAGIVKLCVNVPP
jgi:hypothetical protein